MTPDEHETQTGAHRDPDELLPEHVRRSIHDEELDHLRRQLRERTEERRAERRERG